MMSKESAEEIFVDGQKFHVPSVALWADLMHAGTYQERLIYYPLTKRLVDQDLQFAINHPTEFKLGLCLDGPLARAWTAMLLFRTEQGWQRVHIERLTCSNCGRVCTTANPEVPSLYIGTPEKWAALTRASHHQQISCPICGTELPRFAIWAEVHTELA